MIIIGREGLGSTTNSVITGLIDQSWESTQVYPNPTQGKITVHKSELGNLEIYDSNGAFKRMFKVGSVNQQIDIQELNAGSYFIVSLQMLE